MTLNFTPSQPGSFLLCALMLAVGLPTLAILNADHTDQSLTRQEADATLSFLHDINMLRLGRPEDCRHLPADWRDAHATLFDGCQPGPYAPGFWGVSLARDDKIYLLVRNWQPGHVFQFPNTEFPLHRDQTRALNGGEVSCRWATGVEIFMETEERDPFATVIELTATGPTTELHQVHVPDWRDPTLNARPEAIDRWRQRRFGMFIHWGPVSVQGTEISWSRRGSKLGRIRYGGAGLDGEYRADPVYDNLYRQFNPEAFDANAWVELAEDAGMQYMVLTVKHHDGFCLHDSAVTDYDIMATPYGRDICAQLATACQAEDMGLGWYYSPRDWYHPDFVRNHEAYLDFYHQQITELCTNYGPVDVMWFDCLDSPQYIWGTTPEYIARQIYALQPNIVINDRGGLRGDFTTPENRVGRFDRHQAWETCATIGEGWAYRPNSQARSVRSCIHLLANTAGRDGNLLLNIGPTPDGTVPADQAEALQGIGEWMTVHGESIYGTRGGPYLPADWGTATCKDQRVFLHVLHWPAGDQPLTIPTLPAELQSARLLSDGTAVDIEEQGDDWLLTVSPDRRNAHNTVIELTIDQTAFNLPLTPPSVAGEIETGEPTEGT